jgi:C-terminal processing protease CtpA/Prc
VLKFSLGNPNQLLYFHGRTQLRLPSLTANNEPLAATFMRLFTLIIFTILILGNGLNAQAPSNKAKDYLDKVITLIETNYYFIDSIDFVSVKSKAYTLINNAKKRADTYNAIDTILNSLYEKHNFFLRPLLVKKLNEIEPLIYPSGKIIDNQIGYIKVPHMFGNFDLIQSWSDSLRNIYEGLKNPNIKGWIVDLRGNKGGAMGPMINGLYPFFGDTTIFSLKYRNGSTSTYKFLNGYFTETKNSLESRLMTYKNGDINKNKIAVLIDNNVGSSGEITTIALKGLTNTKFFGIPTAGVPTSVRSYTLSDKAFIGFVTGVHFDSNGKEYKTSINPDVFVKQNKESINDQTIKKATEWLLEK